MHFICSSLTPLSYCAYVNHPNNLAKNTNLALYYTHCFIILLLRLSYILVEIFGEHLQLLFVPKSER